MNLNGWNEFLWRVVVSRLYKPGRKLYLAFDESLLEEELEGANIEIPEGGATNALNNCIQRHCQPMRSGFLGLSRAPDGRCWRDNWNWVFEADEKGRSLALTFAVQQILAAEHMESVSFYTAYWGMFSATADETRINPFGDQGRSSFAMLWERLGEELVGILNAEQSEITFLRKALESNCYSLNFGQGSNKYRNLPVSQSLLSEGDMRLAAAAIRNAARLSDDHLYAKLRRIQLSSSGRRKVFIAALKDSLVGQFREYLESRALDDRSAAQVKKLRRRTTIDVSNLFLYEDCELFGDSVFHCASTEKVVSVPEVLESYLSENRCLVFEEKEDRISATSKQVLQPVGADVFILGLRAGIEEMLSLVPLDDSVPPLGRHFARVNSSLANDFAVVRCQSLPATLANVDISSKQHQRSASAVRDGVEIEFRGGLCVNKVLNAYILSFGPDSIECDGVRVEGGDKCELDSDEMAVNKALSQLSTSKVPCRFELRISDRSLYVNMVEGAIYDLEPAYVLSDFCLLPVALTDDLSLDDMTGVISACDVHDGEWPDKRRKLVRTLEAAMTRRDVRWIRASNPSVDECLAVASYLNLPHSLVTQIKRKTRATKLVPWPFFNWWKTERKM